MANYLILFIVCCHIGMAVIFLSNLFYLKKRKKTSGHSANHLISILIPARNEAQNLKRLIPTILEQQEVTFELILYDDASEDDTWRVISAFDDPRIRALSGDGPPPGWAGKVHALYRASARAKGNAFLFLDADVAFNDVRALSRLLSRYEQLLPDSVLTGLPRYKGKGLLLVSLATHALLAYLPWLLVRRLPLPSLGALNGQCWMIDAEVYKTYQPHKHVADKVLEDVLISRYLKKQGVSTALVDLQREVSVYMYDSFADAWRGFRKNVFLLMGNHIMLFIPLFVLFIVVYILPLFLEPGLLLLLYFNKLATDRRSGFSLSISLLAPLCYVIGSTLQVDSAWHYLTGNVTWKGRSVISP